ncbi:MAG: hypothetical protein IJA94_04610 [Bacilli bacterium]|nr:hypothetical protein [Bacilli bacterium]
MKFNELRSKYSNFVYHDYKIEELDDVLVVTYNMEIEGLSKFNPCFKVDKNIITNQNINKDLLEYLIFNIGMAEAISYYKVSCPKNFIIKAGYLDEEALGWWRKLYHLGLGEFSYVNGIDITEEDLVVFKCLKDKTNYFDSDFSSSGNIICIGGGKDSIVSLETLKDMDNVCFTINAKEIHKDCIKTAGYDSFINVTRILDQNMLSLNKQGYLNGHTPFSSIVAFYSYLIAYLTNRKYIILSNESSANEPTVLNTKINHQYSKSIEFEKDFNNYAKKYFNLDIYYFSVLRPLKEIQIAYLFSKLEKYHYIFKSCNVGSKTLPWKWCGDCPKCLFVFIILSPFLDLDYLSDIFGKNLYEDQNLLNTFLELLGKKETKPFECVGTVEEVGYAVSKAIRKNQTNLPFLLKYYQGNFELLEDELLDEYNTDHLLPLEFENIIKRQMNKND